MPHLDSWLHGLAGGLLIGLGSILALAATGKIPGISGIVARILKPRPGDIAWRVLFLVGLLAGAAITITSYTPAGLFRLPEGRTLPIYAIAGLIVGFGTRLGGGCTSGHGICGIGSGARDSIVATITFMAAGMLTVFLWKTFN
ncbi:MAG: YeeE/YedE family protein [Verrucomicrobiales bacterium]